MSGVIAAVSLEVHGTPSPPSRVHRSRQEVIAISQDALGRQAVRTLDSEEGVHVPLPLVPPSFWGRVRTCFGTCRKVQVWVKPLANHSVAVAFLNLGDQWSASRASFPPELIEVSGTTLEDLGGVRFAGGPLCVRDALRRQDVEVVPEGTVAAAFRLRRSGVEPRTHELLVLRPCACSEAGR